MLQAPLPIVGGTGIVTWTNPSSPPASWVLENCLNDQSYGATVSEMATVAGTVTSINVKTAGWQGGCLVKLYGLDGAGNVVLAPNYSTGLTVNQ
jgi:hypothetical protein